MTAGGTVETTGTETKTGFCKTGTPYEGIVSHLMGVNWEASSPIQLKFELPRDFMPVVLTCKFEDLIKDHLQRIF